MADELSRVEFLGPPEDADDIAWLDEDGESEDLEGSRGSSLLPPRTTARRALISLLIFALALSTTGLAGVRAFRRDHDVQAAASEAANELVLRETAAVDPLALTDPGESGDPGESRGVGTWRMDPSVSIAVGMTNESPDPITLLPDATLLGPGMSGPATLQPSGRSLLRPGQSERLIGVATVECGIQTERTPGVPEDDTVLVQARTTSGAVGVATVALDGGTGSIRSEICAEASEAPVANFPPEAEDPVKHAFTAFTANVTARSLAAQATRYQEGESYASSIMPIDAIDGPMSTEPEDAVESIETVVLAARLNANGAPAVFQADGFDFDTVVGTACGLLA